MSNIISDLERKYQIELDDVQKSALSSLIDFITDERKTLCLSGRAGTGKSTLVKIFKDILDSKHVSYTCLTPTNKSKSIYNDSKVQTIHGFLQLRPEIDILDFDATQLTFSFGSRGINRDNILIVDECSMVNDDLFRILKGRCIKLLAVGDAQQLAPVKQLSISEIFKSETIYLTNVHRQPDSCIQKVLNYLRKKPLYKFKSISDEGGSITIVNNINKMLKDYSYLFKLSDDLQDRTLVKLITYTNKRIDALNQLIRKYLYTTNFEYQIGEILTGYDTCSCHNECIDNSVDYVVKKVYPEIIHGMKGYKLLLTSNSREFSVLILSRYNSPEEFKRLTLKLETLRQKAVKTKSKALWRQFYCLNDSFLTPVDLVYDNRVIKRKSLDYGYCISTHKSQSSSYSIVMIDMENLWRCPDKEQLRQLQYVACSRTMSDLIIYQKDD